MLITAADQQNSEELSEFAIYIADKDQFDDQNFDAGALDSWMCDLFDAYED